MNIHACEDIDRLLARHANDEGANDSLDIRTDELLAR
jgi:hypothetical protein